MSGRYRFDSSSTTGEVAALIGARCEGPADRLLAGVASLDVAAADEITFCSGGRWLSLLPTTRAGAVILASGEVPEGCVALYHPTPRAAYARLAAAMVPLHWPEPSVHPTAIIHETASVHPNACIEPYVVVGPHAEIGDGAWLQAHVYIGERSSVGPGCRLMPGAVLMERSRLGSRVCVQPGAVIGADGFGHVPGPDGPIRVPQLGVAVLEDDVEVGANACVDRAALGETHIGKGSRLDNLVQVAHGAQLGASCLLAAFAGVAGGARLGNRVVMAGRSAVVDGIVVGDDVVFAGLASASKDVPSERRLGGSPARNYQQWLREVAALRGLPRALRALHQLEKRVGRALGETEET